MNEVTALNIFLNYEYENLRVGELIKSGKYFGFEYTPEFVNTGLEISPYRLPLKTGFSQTTDFVFQGIPGVFNDSLPDGWGLLLMDRFFRTKGLNPYNISPLTRLACIGNRGLGALSYEPQIDIDDINFEQKSLYELFEASQHVIRGDVEEILSELLVLGGSPAGARPKVIVSFNEKTNELYTGTQDIPEDFHSYIVKFTNPTDHIFSGQLEYAYSLMAKKAGIIMPPCQLFESKNKLFFGVKRFDREGKKRFHNHTLSGLLHADFRVPNLDYIDFLKVTWDLTKNAEDKYQAFRRMIFNIYAHNRDDHSKNFSFLLRPEGWVLAPAYDLTFSVGIGGEHTLSIAGIGKDPQMADIIKVANTVGIPRPKVNKIIEEVTEAISLWKEFSDQSKIPKKTSSEISKFFHYPNGKKTY